MYLAWGGEYLLSSPKSDTYSKKTVVLIQTKGLEHVAKYLRITTTWSNNKHITDYCSRGNWSICITGWIISMFAGADKRRTRTLLGQTYLQPEIGGDLHYRDYNVNATEYH